MSQQKDNTEQKTYELSEDEVRRITRKFIAPGGDDEDIADFLLILKSIAYAPSKDKADDIVFYAEDETVRFSPAACQAVRELVDKRHQATQGA